MVSFSFSFVLVKGFVKTFPPSFYKTTRGLLCKKDLTVTKPTTKNNVDLTHSRTYTNQHNTTTAINNTELKELKQQKQQKQWQQDSNNIKIDIKVELTKIQKRFERAIIFNNK